MKSSRKGIALLWAVLTSALILVAIFGISMKVVPQKKVENARAYTVRALAVAESGLADIAYRLRTDTPAPSSNGSVIVKTVLQGGQPYDSGDIAYNSGIAAGDSTYRVRIKKTTSGYAFYSLGTVGTASAPLAKQAIKMSYSGAFPISTYALLAQTSIDVQNSTVVGNIFANTYVDVRLSTMLNGAAYCPTNDFRGALTALQKDGTVNEINVPKVNLSAYRAQWEAFLSGTYPYNGADPDYPNTRLTPAVHDFIVNTLGVTTGPALQAKFVDFFAKLKAGTSLEAAYLRNFMNKGTLVFDINQDQAGSSHPVTFGSSYSNDGFVLQGTIIVEGNVKFDGGAYIGIDPFKTSILVTGFATVSGGQSTINGLLYIEGCDAGNGNQQSLSISATGGLACTGSIVAQAGIKFNSSALAVTWVPNRIYESDIQRQLETMLESKLSPVPSSWQQISYDVFLAGQ